MDLTEIQEVKGVMEIQETNTGKSHTCSLSSISFRAALPQLPGAQVRRQSTPSSRGEHAAVLDSGPEAGLSSSPYSLQSLSRGDTGHWDPAAQHSQHQSPQRGEGAGRTILGSLFLKPGLGHSAHRRLQDWERQRASPDLPPAQH